MKKSLCHLLPLILFFFVGCRNSVQELTTHVEKTRFNTIVNYDINFLNDTDVLFYFVQIKCLNKESYSNDEMELLDFENLLVVNSQSIKTVKLLKYEKNDKIQLTVNDEIIITRDLPSALSTSYPNKIKFCTLKPNALFDYSYDYKSDDNDKIRYKCEIGFLPISKIASATNDTIMIDWNATFNNGNNLFEIYRALSNCDDQPFHLKFTN